MNPPVLRLLRRALAASLLAFSCGGLVAEPFTLTSQDGRTIKADVLSVNGDQVRIKREDGQIFTVALSSLSAADQARLKEWAKTNAAKLLPTGAIQVEMSRAKFDTTKKDIDVKLTSGEVVKDGRTITEEKWGYAITVSNRTAQPLSFRAEYRLFATIDDIHKANEKGLKKKAHSTPIETIPELGRVTFRTETISAIRSKYNGNIVSAKTGDSTSRETLHGVWMRIYSGDQLLYEAAMPESLRNTEKW